LDQPELPISGVDEAIVERVGPFPSPSVLIDGTNVMRSDQPPEVDFCLLDLPSREVILTALRRAVTAGSACPRGAYMITDTPAGLTKAPMTSHRSGRKPSRAVPQASEPATNTPP
jgi:hypothetical protein